MLVQERNAALEELRIPAVVVVQDRQVRGLALRDSGVVLRGTEIDTVDEVPETRIGTPRGESLHHLGLARPVLADSDANRGQGLGERRADRLGKVRGPPAGRDADIDQDRFGCSSCLAFPLERLPHQ